MSTTLSDSDNAELIIPTDTTVDDSPPEGVDPALWLTFQDEHKVKEDMFLYQLKRGMKGHNIGLDNGMAGLNKYIYGTHKARYYLIGAESGVGKTTIGDFMYVLKAWESAKARNKRIKIFYCSFEVSKMEKLFKWTSYYLFVKFGVLLHSDYLQGRVTGKLVTDDLLPMILQAYTAVREMMEDVIVVEDVMHPTKIFEALIEEHFTKEGIVDRSPVPPEELKKNPKKKGYVRGYTEHDPELITILFIDHLALAGTEKNLDTKGIMDKMSKYCIVLRNLFHCTIVVLQQFSTDMMSTYRSAFSKKSESVISPSRLDFGDSKATYRDACVVMGGVKPQKDMNEFFGYDLSADEGLGDYFVAWYLMKNRYGPANRMLPLFLNPIAGIVYDLPRDNNPFAMEPWHKQAKHLEELCQKYSPQQS